MEWLVGPMAGGLFDYNRENFFFDWEQRLKREFQGQNMRVKQFGLYRDDVRDLMGLTVSKMDNYLIVNAFTLGICVMLFTMGRPESGKSAQWVYWLSFMTTASALFYTLMSMWLAMHASVAAHSFGVRMLTQAVRLPIPSKQQLDAATAAARDYENRSLADMLRVPVVAQQMRRLQAMDNVTQEPGQAEAAMSDDESDMESNLQVQTAAAASALKHLKLYRKLQANWQAYDAYARVSMAMGANQLLHAVSYFTVRMLVSEERSAWPGFCCLTIVVFAAWLLASLDLYLTPRVLALAAVLLFLPPVFTMTGIVIAQSEHAKENELLSDICAPSSFLMHILWILFFWKVAKPTVFNGVALPTNFRSVLYLDVFGWLKQPDDAFGRGSAATANGAAAAGRDVRGRSVSLASDPAAESVLGPGSVQAQDSFVRAQLAAQVMVSRLLTVCRGLEAAVTRELQAWESEEMRSMLSMETAKLKEVDRLRRRFDLVLARRQEAVDRLPASALPAGTVAPPAEEPPRLWLEMEWWSSGMPIPVWYDCDTKQSVWTLPKEPDRVSTLLLLDEEITLLSSKVEELSDFQMPSSGGPLTLEELGRNGAAGDLTAEGAEGEAGAAAGEGEGEGEGEGRPHAGSLATAGTDDEPFGGREAVPIERFPQDTDNFHPCAAVRASSSRRPRRRKIKQGKLPWQTFSQGSLYMAGVWAIGLFWCTWRVLDHSIDIVSGDGHGFASAARLLRQSVGAGAAPRVEGRLELFRGPWPHPFFQPLDLHCDASGRLLVAETFGVHGLSLQATRDHSSPLAGTWAPMPFLDACLSEAPEFLEAGLQGVSSACRGEGAQACDAVLLAASGTRALRCGNATGSRAASVGSVPGGPWRSLAAAGETLLAVRSGGASAVALRAAPAAIRAGGWMPAFELFAPAARPSPQLTKVVMMGSRAILKLDDRGFLQAVPLSSPEGGSGALWSRQLPGHSQWDSLCLSEAERAVYLLGRQHRNDRFLIARLPLPGELSV